VIGIAEAAHSDSVVDLLRLAAAGDHAAFAAIVRRHHLDLVRVGYVVSGSSDLADQAAAAAWVIAWKQLGRIREPEKLKGWLCTVAANEARQLMRRQRRRSVVEIAVDSVGEHGTALHDPQLRVRDIDLARALDQLAPNDRALVALRYVAGLNSTELARATGMTASGTRARLARLLERLRKELDDER
jgi:RNA polymerase sigma-70 factor (ECF subfamily)